MAGSQVMKLLETLFRRWWLFLLPLVLLAAAGAASVDAERSYRSSGTLYVEGETLLSTLTEVRGGNIGWQTPAGFFNQQLVGLLQTDAFIATVADRAGIDEGLYLTRAAMLDDVRRSVGSWTAGDNLLKVGASHADPQVAHRLADAVTDGFVQWQIESDVSESTAAQRFFLELVEPYQVEASQARAALDEYLLRNPDPEGDAPRPTSEQVAIDRLTAEVEQAEARLIQAQAKEEEARLATAQTESDVRQRLQIVDVPQLPLAPDPVLRDAAIHVALFVAVGAVLSVAALVAATWADRSIRSPGEVRQRLDVPLLAVLPDAKV